MKVREGSVYRRCRCGRTLTAKGTRPPKRCQGCDASTTTAGAYTWSFRVDVHGRGEPRKTRSGHGFEDADAAERALLELRQSIADDSYVAKVPDSFGDYLKAWLDGIRHEVSAGTWASYEGHVRNYVAPRLGNLRLQDVTRPAIRQALADLRNNGRIRGDGGLAPKTCHNVYLTLHVALESAVKDRLLARNPAADAYKVSKDVDPDTVSRRDQWWKREDIDAFLDHVRDDDLYAMWHTFLWTGARRGEVAAMRWKDLDLDKGTWTITRQWRKGRDGRPEIATLKQHKPGKKNRQRRTVALVPETVAALRRHRAHQNELRLLHGEDYEDHGLVFCHPNGAPLHPDGISQRWDRHVRRMQWCAACDEWLPSKGYTCSGCGADLAARDENGRATGLRDDAYGGQRTMRLHDARHSHATWCLDQGMPLHQVSRRLGHASIQITADLYGHDDIESQQAALGAALRLAREVGQ